MVVESRAALIDARPGPVAWSAATATFDSKFLNLLELELCSRIERDYDPLIIFVPPSVHQASGVMQMAVRPECSCPNDRFAQPEFGRTTQARRRTLWFFAPDTASHDNSLYSLEMSNTYTERDDSSDDLRVAPRLLSIVNLCGTQIKVKRGLKARVSFPSASDAPRDEHMNGSSHKKRAWSMTYDTDLGQGAYHTRDALGM
ncbi:hypothetical protein EVG20_g8549 [Dentipellis fragilis]|uniref:Uncharacterized protein n=1 Tax=Dentipellis fragilis TaxID=205917 RepID=A0A4Y9Y4L3_9AGAM|nr:hypothetical protein EVG20_g8549 [Dentipellis fragilis]